MQQQLASNNSKSELQTISASKTAFDSQKLPTTPVKTKTNDDKKGTGGRKMGPNGPMGPMGPDDPMGYNGPGGPMRPGSPMEPRGPMGPGGPMGPNGPMKMGSGGPMGPRAMMSPGPGGGRMQAFTCQNCGKQVTSENDK